MTRRLSNQAVQIAVLVVVATVLALATNAVASRTRKLSVKGWYPDATTVPVRAETPPQDPTPAAAPIEVPTATVEQPVVVPDAKPATVTSAPVIEPAKAPAAAPVPAAAKVVEKVDLAAKFPPHPDKAYVEIGGDDVVLLHANGALFLDARRTSIYEAGHIAGARTMSVWESDVDDKVNALFNERSDPREQLLPIVIYCSGGDCEDSHMLAQKLWGAQFNNIYVYKDGFPDWEKRQGKVRSGATP